MTAPFDNNPTRIFLLGDRNKSQGFVKEAQKMLFQVKNFGTAQNILKRRYADGTEIKVISDIGGIDNIYINSISGGRIQEVKRDIEIFPVPIVLAYEIYTAASDSVGGFVAEKFSGRMFEYVENNKEDKVEYIRDDVTLEELEKVGVYDLIDYDGNYDDEAIWVTNDPAPPYDSGDAGCPPDIGCPADYIYQQITPWNARASWWEGGAVPATFPFFIHGSDTNISAWCCSSACMHYLTGEYYIVDTWYGIGTHHSGQFVGTSYGAYSEDYSMWTTGVVSVDIGKTLMSGTGYCTLDIMAGMVYNYQESFISGSKDSNDADCGTDVWLDCSAYWDKTGDYILGVNGKERYSGTESQELGPFDDYYDTSNHASTWYGYTESYKNFLKVVTTTRDVIVWESQLYDYNWEDSNGIEDGWYYYFTTVDIFDYNNKPFYMYCFSAWNDNAEEQSIVQYGMIYKDEHYAIKFNASVYKYDTYHAFDTATVINDKNEEKTVELPDSMKNLYGAPEDNNHCVKAGKYTLSKTVVGEYEQR